MKITMYVLIIKYMAVVGIMYVCEPNVHQSYSFLGTLGIEIC